MSLLSLVAGRFKRRNPPGVPQDVDESTAASLLRDVQLFVNETGVSEYALGRRAVNDGGIIGRVKAGRTITLDSFDKLRIAMAEIRAAQRTAE